MDHLQNKPQLLFVIATTSQVSRSVMLLLVATVFYVSICFLCLCCCPVVAWMTKDTGVRCHWTRAGMCRTAIDRGSVAHRQSHFFQREGQKNPKPTEDQYAAGEIQSVVLSLP